MNRESTNNESSFRLSRIHAEGWNAARRIPLARLGTMSAEAIGALNPYAQDLERNRWSAGFNRALASWQR